MFTFKTLPSIHHFHSRSSLHPTQMHPVGHLYYQVSIPIAKSSARLLTYLAAHALDTHPVSTYPVLSFTSVTVTTLQNRNFPNSMISTTHHQCFTDFLSKITPRLVAVGYSLPSVRISPKILSTASLLH